MDDFSGMMGSFGTSDYWLEPDFLLSSLVSLMANKMDSQLGVTLVVKGNIMTGVLVGEREYLTAVNNIFKSMAKDTIPNPTKDELRMIEESFHFDQMTEDVYSEDLDEDDDEEDYDVNIIRHLHLKDPVIIYPNAALSFMESPLPILRIKLSTVDGWMLGRMSLVSSDELEDMPRPRPRPDNDIRH
jgi:hypothetical protein